MHAGESIYDAAIIGGGPAGASCALWLARLGYRVVLLDAAPAIGGLCRSHPFVDCWNASLPGATGPQVADNLALSLEQAGVPLRLSTIVTDVHPCDAGFSVQTADGLALQSHYVVLATGVRARALPALNGVPAPAGSRAVPGVAMPVSPQVPPGVLVQSGVLMGPGSHIVEQDFRGKRVAVLGGGDNAFENALYVREHGAREVHIYARTVRAQSQFVRRFPACQVFTGAYAADAQSRTVNGQAYDFLLVFYGWEPCVDYADALALRRGASGFIETDMASAQASFPGVYAVGEVAQRLHPCVVTALADGVTAAKAIQARLEARR